MIFTKLRKIVLFTQKNRFVELKKYFIESTFVTRIKQRIR